jgi:hypothetical protein
VRSFYRTFLIFIISTSAFATDNVSFAQYYWMASSGIGTCTGTKATCASTTASGACAIMNPSWSANYTGNVYTGCQYGGGEPASAGVTRYTNNCYNNVTLKGVNLSSQTTLCYQTCPPGQYNNGGVSPGVCVDQCGGNGSIWNSEYETCTPNCVAPKELNPLTVGSTTTFSCVEPLGNSPEPCSDIVGYITDTSGVEHQVCNDEKNACEQTGGAFGYVNGEATCVSDNYGAPSCSGTQVLTQQLSGWACLTPSPPDDPANPDIPNSQNPLPPDDDNDGTPNNNDSDMDGDGTPNSSDGDIDGDGIANADDPTPEGEEETPSEVSGGASCESRPNCTGDAVQCAILYQGWAARCLVETAKTTNGAQCVTPPTCSGPEWQCAASIQEWRTRCEAQDSEGQGATATTALADFATGNPVTTLDKPSTDLEDLSAGIFSNPSVGGSCPPPETVNLLGQSFSFSYDNVCGVAGDIRPFVLLFAYLLALRNLIGAT